MDPDNIAEILRLGAPAYVIKKLADPQLERVAKQVDAYSQRLWSRASQNLDRIFSRTGDLEQDGLVTDHVSVKALHQIIENGVLASDELSADYFRGLLISSWTEDARDDRGAAHARLIGGLSSYEIRAHYLIYRGLLSQIQGSGALITFDHVRTAMTIYAPWDSVVQSMDFRQSEDPHTIVGHALTGLSRHGLIDSYFGYGKRDTLRILWPGVSGNGMVVAPSAYGAEVFMWALGMGQVPMREFSELQLAEVEFSDICDLDGVQLTEGDRALHVLTEELEPGSGFEDKRTARYAEDL